MLAIIGGCCRGPDTSALESLRCTAIGALPAGRRPTSSSTRTDGHETRVEHCSRGWRPGSRLRMRKSTPGRPAGSRCLPASFVFEKVLTMVVTVAVTVWRAPLIRMAFETYANGDYSISAITELLDASGSVCR